MRSPLQWSKSSVPFVRTAEVWVPQRELFMFRFIVPSRGDRWTFVVHLADLEELAGHQLEPETGFHLFRLEIYEAAKRRMLDADPTEQQRLNADEISPARSLSSRTRL
jgi:hypothetical protein